MYSTCLFCNADLGTNEVVEHFPVGRRLAFDAAKGRLWVVCRRCERWNLTPLEERWEAIEECERQFANTRRRVSTDNVGLARLPEGLELVRIGQPQRPELAAWRYGDQFGRRRRRNLLLSGAVVAGAGAVLVGGMVAGVGGVLFTHAFGMAAQAYRSRQKAHIPLADRGTVETNLLLASESELRLDGDVPVLHTAIVAPARPGGTIGKGVAPTVGIPLTLRGEEAVRAAGAILPLLNRYGGADRDVRSAVELLETAPDPHALYRKVAVDAKRAFEARSWQWGEWGTLRKLPAPVRLALEMAAHEERERRALEGELAELEAAWRQAEEIAAIADDMFVGDGIRGALSRIRKRGNS